ncbi:hypothetical protein [Mycobacterium aquaticum]|uniref:hypothetical protein n=1 Tax=Mycobacterium aquaticum TaxID=1927124 RepID=UPI00114FCFE1|nr:hypothetical protein [Mycobacterium aquaticum]
MAHLGQRGYLDAADFTERGECRGVDALIAGTVDEMNGLRQHRQPVSQGSCAKVAVDRTTGDEERSEALGNEGDGAAQLGYR